MAIAVAVQWISNYLVSWTLPMMDKNSYLLKKFNHGFAYWIWFYGHNSSTNCVEACA